MDYEKLHKETLVVLQQIVSEGKITEEIARSICADFVKENEDERISKAIKEAVCHYWNDDTQAKTDCLAWLEKQGEQKPTWNEKIKGLNELETYILSLVPNRPLDAIKVDAKNIRYIINKEQNPAWSEEDEKYYDSALWHIKNSCGIEGNIYNWLKYLKERIKGK